MATGTTERGALTHPDVTRLDDVNRDVLKMLDRPRQGVVGAVRALPSRASGSSSRPGSTRCSAGSASAGSTSPVGWGVYITTFVFWVGIAHSGTLISAILFLFRAPWRQSIYRAAEAMTVFAVMTAGLFPLIHVGRLWHAYWLVPYPELALPVAELQVAAGLGRVRGHHLLHGVRDLLLSWARFPTSPRRVTAATGLRKKLYSVISLGWQGTDRAVAPLRQGLHLPRRAGDAAGALGALRRVLGLRDGHRAGLARDDLRAVLRGRRHLLRRRDGDHARRAAAEDLRARGATSPRSTSTRWRSSACSRR